MIATEKHKLDELLARLSEHPASVALADRMRMARQLENFLVGAGPRIPSRLVGPLAGALASDPWHQVRKRVANVLHLLPEEDFERIGAILSQDSSAYVRRAAERGRIRRWRSTRHEGHVHRVMSEVVKLAPQLAAEERARPTASPATTTVLALAEEEVTLDEFMRRFCRSTTNIASKRTRILSSARNKTIRLPSLARPAHRGRPHLFHVKDLLQYWPHWLADGLPLPQLKTQL